MVKRQRKSSNTVLYIALAAILVVGAVLIYRSAAAPDRATTIADIPASNVQAEGYLYGNPDAPVQILEFADFQCPACGDFATITEPDVRKRLIDTGIASMRFFDFPLPQHRNSLPAHNAAACAHEQARFWEMHDAIFAAQGDWSNASNPKRHFSGYARSLGLDVSRWDDCYDDRRYESRIRANQREGERRLVQSTPTFVVGNRLVPGALPYDALKRLVDTVYAETQRAAPAKMSDAKASDTTKRP